MTNRTSGNSSRRRDSGRADLNVGDDGNYCTTSLPRGTLRRNLNPAQEVSSRCHCPGEASSTRRCGPPWSPAMETRCANPLGQPTIDSTLKKGLFVPCPDGGSILGVVSHHRRADYAGVPRSTTRARRGERRCDSRPGATTRTASLCW